MSKSPSPGHQEFVQNYLAFGIALGLLMAFGVLLHIFYHPYEVPIDELRALFLRPDYVEPEVRERAQFLAFVVLLLPVSVLAIKIVQKKSEHWLAKIFRKEDSPQNKYGYVASFSLPLLMTIPFIGSHFYERIIPHQLSSYWILTPLVILPAAIWLFFRILALSTVRQSQQNLTSVLAWILALEIFASVIFFRVYNLSMVNEEPIWTFHFEAFFYTIAQVLGGQTLLADLPASYGLYGEILKPLLEFTGASVLAITLLMAALQITALFGLLWA